MEKKFIDSTYIFRKFVNRALRTMRSTLMLLLRRLFLSLHRCLVSYRRFHLLLHCLHLIKANNIPLLITFYSLAHIALASFSLSLAFYIDVYYHWTNTWDDFWCIKSMRTNKVIPLMLITSVRHYLVERQTSTNETKEGNIRPISAQISNRENFLFYLDKQKNPWNRENAWRTHRLGYNINRKISLINFWILARTNTPFLKFWIFVDHHPPYKLHWQIHM